MNPFDRPDEFRPPWARYLGEGANTFCDAQELELLRAFYRSWEAIQALPVTITATELEHASRTLASVSQAISGYRATHG